MLIAGSGAREHALAWACARGRDDVELICAPGNGGTAAIATNIAVAADDPAGIVRAARDLAVALVVIGPDGALAAGVADACAAEGIAVFGPTAAAARIESSKAYAKSLMDAAGIPTARWRTGTVESRAGLLGFVEDLHGHCVVKADGLALGKGVVMCDSVGDARAAISACLDDERFGSAGHHVVVEERLQGPEVTVMALTDGRNIRILPVSRDYKRIGDGDTGLNTGGMGAVTPPPGLAVDLAAVERDVLRPCVDALADAGTPFAGCLYAQLMLTDAGPRVVEFNARFGDPEAQAVLPVMDTDVLSLLFDCAHGTLATAGGPASEPYNGAGRAAVVAHRAGGGAAEVHADAGGATDAHRTAGGAAEVSHAAVALVLAAAGYPGPPSRDDRISGLDRLDPAILVFHAGTRRHADGTLRTDGGRVLTLVARGPSLRVVREQVYSCVADVHFDGAQHRTDIGIDSERVETR